jgi:hypothetical protein
MSTSLPPNQTTAFAHQAAKASWATAIVIFVLVAFGGRVGARVLIEFVALFLMVVGFTLGVTALFGIRKHGMKGILAPAMVGIILNGLLFFIFVTNFLAARAKAQQHSSAAALPVVIVSSEAPGQPITYGIWRMAQRRRCSEAGDRPLVGISPPRGPSR